MGYKVRKPKIIDKWIYSNVNSICFSPDGISFASACDSSVILWDLQTEKLKQILNGHIRYVNTICFSPDSQVLVSGSDDKSIMLWDVQTGAQKFQLFGHSKSVNSVSFSPNGLLLASCSSDKTVRIWDLQGLSQFLFYKGLANENDYSIFQNHMKSFGILKFNPIVTTVYISQQPLFQASKTLIYQGEFRNRFGMNLLPILLEKGGILLKDQKK